MVTACVPLSVAPPPDTPVIAIVAVSINTKPKFIVFIISALFSVILKDLPWNLWIITSAIISILIGVLISYFREGIK